MKKWLLFVALLTVSFFTGCRKTVQFPGSNIELSFSQDTLYLDTVFTGLGSSTYSFTVRNPSHENITIDRIFLGRGESSFYRLNINGLSARSAENIELLAGDSAYIFVEITPQVGAANTLVYTDSVLFETGSVRQHVDLVTAVWDAHYHFPNRVLTIDQPEPYPDLLIPYAVLSCNEVWTNDKPHVVYGYAVVDSACSLHINPGTQVHFHQGSGLWVYRDGALEVDGLNLGSIEAPVVFQGDRLEPGYEYVPGQWGGLLGGIFIMGGEATQATINNAVIKNATTALRVDSSGSPSSEVRLHNTIISHNSRVGLYGGYGRVTATNSVFGPAGYYAFYGLGGHYRLEHCTLLNTWNFSSRNGTALGLFNWFEDGNGTRYLRDVQASVTNSVVSGTLDNEVSLGIDAGGSFDVRFDHSALRIDPNPQSGHYSIADTALFSTVYFNQAWGWTTGLQFPNGQLNYVPDSASTLVAKSVQTNWTPLLDLHGKGRSIPGTLGAVERE